jgi:hypothetical protein
MAPDIVFSPDTFGFLFGNKSPAHQGKDYAPQLVFGVASHRKDIARNKGYRGCL